MSSKFYLRLAADNIKKNSRNYVPYILTSSITVAMFYIIRSLTQNEGINNLPGADAVKVTLGLGGAVTAIFSVIFLFYTNSFLMKRRKKEFGLFNILGMEKRHIARIIGIETLYVFLIMLAVGFIIGMSLDKLMFLAITRILNTDVPIKFQISINAVTGTIILAAGVNLLIFFNSIRQVGFSKPIELLKSKNTGEKEPKSKWIIALLGALFLGTGYFIALRIKNPVAAMAFFFVAVICVIIGTYLIFTAGSIVFLKILKKNKRFYYKTKNFISTSGMIYRMKQNAVGLANICILSTMVLVMISSTASLMIGIDDITDSVYPYDYSFIVSEPSGDDIKALDKVSNAVKNEDITDMVRYRYVQFSTIADGNVFSLPANPDEIGLIKNIAQMHVLTLADYNSFSGEDQTLQENEVLIYTEDKAMSQSESVILIDTEYKVKGFLKTKIVKGNNIMGNSVPILYVVVSDDKVFDKINQQQQECYKRNSSDIKVQYSFDLKGSESDLKRVNGVIEDVMTGCTFNGSYEFKPESKQEVRAVYGGLMFIGVFLGLLFTMAAILIIYYKQISEGYDDKERFDIMQKVGLSRDEVKKSIRSQILTVFFMPPVTAGIHLMFAFPMISKILKCLYLYNVALYIKCTVCCYIVFLAIYAVVYLMTAKTYYRIVKR